MKQIYCLLKEGKYGVTRFSKKKYIKYKIYRTIILLKKKKIQRNTRVTKIPTNKIQQKLSTQKRPKMSAEGGRDEGK